MRMHSITSHAAFIDRNAKGCARRTFMGGMGSARLR